MGPPVRPNKQAFATGNPIGKQNLFESSSDAMFNNLWVGNLAADVTDSDLRNLFEKHGAVDSVTSYPSRSYAFINMKRPEDAKRAKESLQGFVLRGSALKIDFAKPAKPCKSLWVSGISSSTSKEDLEEEFSKFGKFEDFKFIRDKNTAYIDYSRLEDASKALKMMHGKKRGGSVIRVDYLRSQPKRDQGPDFRDAKEGQHFRSMGPHDSPWLPPDAVKNYPDSLYYGPKRKQHMEGRKGDGEQPSNILLISYPPIVHVDEQMLHNAMILFGEIDNIRSFPSRHHSLVEFRSIEEAQLAKDGLQGRLFNDPRILIMFSTNDQTPNKDIPGFHPHGLYNELPIPPVPQLDPYGHPLLIIPNRPYPGPGGPFLPPDNFDPDFNLPLPPPPMNPIGNWRRRSSPTTPVSNPNPSPGTWDVFDGNHLYRESKRMRIEENSRVSNRGSDCDYIWRGVIAKGGTPVCHARCVPIRDWIGYEIPEVVNCSARTGLDMLAKHYTDAIGFDIVFFLPDSEEDFASYTEFVRYLGDRNRAGVAKFDDGTTLFLVPPSDFLYKVLNVSGPERLYGVILKFPPQPPPPSAAQPQYIDKQQIPPQTLQNDYNNSNNMMMMPGGGEKVVQIDYSGGVQHDDLKSPPVFPTSTPPTQVAGLSLTPELIATLASLAKGKFNGGQQQQVSATSAVGPERPWEYPYEPEPEPSSFSEAQPQILPGYGNFPGVMSQSQGQSGHFAVPSQQYVPNFPQAGGYGFEQKPDGLSQVYGGGNNVYQPQSMGGEQKTDTPLGDNNNNNMTQVYGGVGGGAGNVYQPPSIGGGENSSGQLPEQMQQLQSALYAVSQQQQQQPVTDFDADKNERYQSTLQFATNLLLKIHQQQPGQGGGGGGGGGGSLH